MSRPVPTSKWFDETFRELVDAMSKPKAIEFRGATAYRFTEQSVVNAVLLKLARYLSGLNAGELLLTNGYLQELCALQRTLDEIHEDILFLSYPHLGLREETKYHAEFLASFWEEEPEFKAYSGKQKNRHQVPRKTIRSYLSKLSGDDEIDHRSIATSGYLSRVYSGFLHAAAPQLLEIYDPAQEAFRLSGYRDSPLLEDHAQDFQKQIFRGVLTIAVACYLCGKDELADRVYAVHNELEPYFGGT